LTKPNNISIILDNSSKGRVNGIYKIYDKININNFIDNYNYIQKDLHQSFEVNFTLFFIFKNEDTKIDDKFLSTISKLDYKS
jgi:hypothetical protein